MISLEFDITQDFLKEAANACPEVREIWFEHNIFGS